MDDVADALHILVKSFYSVIGRVEAKTFLRSAKPGDAGPEGVRQAVDRRRKGLHVGVDAEGFCKRRDDALCLSGLEVRKIPLTVPHWLVAVSDTHLVHTLEQLVVDAAELFHGVFDLAP